MAQSMTLTTAQIDLIRDSFHRLQPDVQTASELFYVRLFEIAPELRGMFRSDMAGQGMRFMSTLGGSSSISTTRKPWAPIWSASPRVMPPTG